jgi:hypothetical protein
VRDREDPRRVRIVITDEKSGEEVAEATGVEVLVLLVAPDTRGGGSFRRILIGDAEMSAELLFDVLQDVTDKVRRGTVMDLSDAIDDRLLLDVTEGLPLH